MNGKTQSPVTVQQCLFGYEDGHRLLASSLQLPNDAESMLLRLSDLAPGFNDFNAECYWTGVPVTSIKYYALLRTWSAPEMPRPGCVWTHVLLIGFSDIARFVDLAALKRYAVRPTLNSQHNEYSKPLLIDPTIEGGSDDSRYSPQPNYKTLLKVIRAAYISDKPDERPLLFADADELDTSVFRVWSQQWPRLRRSFSFRTAGSLSERTTVDVHFDLQVLPKSDYYPSTENVRSHSETVPWEAAATTDALSNTPTEFRRFLWRYGSDIYDGCERFHFLADLYVVTHQDSPGINRYEDMLLRVAEILPDPEDGKALKSDLLEGERNEYSLMPAVDPLNSLEFLIHHPRVKGLPSPVDSALSALRSLWPTQPETVTKLAEQAVKMKSILHQNILSQLAELMDADSFYSVTFDRPYLRSSLIANNPTLINSDGLLKINQPELSELLKLLPNDQQLADTVIERLVYKDDKDVAEEMFVRFPHIVNLRVIEALEKTSSTSDKRPPRVWLNTITRSAPDFLRGGYIEKMHSVNVLSGFAEALGYSNNDVLHAGPRPWALALDKANDDISGKRRDMFYAFLLMLAIKKPLRGCEPIFEHAFDSIHSALENDKLNRNAQDLVEEALPNLHFWDQWDMCHRLRLAVVRAYVDNKLDQESFHRLTNNHKVADTLIELATETRKGRSFLKEKHQATPFIDKT